MLNTIIGKNLFSIIGAKMGWFVDAYLKMRSKTYCCIVIPLSVGDILIPLKRQQRYFNVDFIGQLYSEMLRILC